MERRPVHRLFAAYALVSAPALLFVHRPGYWPLLLGAHVAAALLVLGLPPFRGIAAAVGRRWPRAQRLLADWYPLLLVPVLYSELAVLNTAVHGGRYFDALILRWEELLFGGQPSQELAAAWPLLPLSEVLHGAYLSYYLIIYGPPLLLYLKGRSGDFHRAAFAVMLTFFVHYLFFIYLPVQGPRYLFPAPGGAIAEGPLYALTHRLLEAGSSQGAAFPSSHVGVAFAQTAVAVRLLPALSPLVALLSAALALGTVYGGFHYATDAVIGLLLGVALAACAPLLRRRLG